MTKELWLNLPVKDLTRSRAFFTKLGFKFNDQYSTKESAPLVIGTKQIVVMLFEEDSFEKVTRNKITDTSTSNEVMISFDAESIAEVDEMAKMAEAAGGTVFGKPGFHGGFMYGCGFTDPDGHRWNVLYMDMSKMPK